MKISALSLALAAVPATILGLSVSACGPAPPYIEGAKYSYKVVLPHATAFVPIRTLVRKLLNDAGATDVKMIFLDIEHDAHMQNVWKRTQCQAKQADSTVEEFFRGYGMKGVVDFDSYCKFYDAVFGLTHQEPQESEKPYTVVDVTAKDVTSGRISTFARPYSLFSSMLVQLPKGQDIFVPEEEDNDNIQMPSVTRANVKSTSIQPHATETDELLLPLGVRLTGGDKLRADGLTGKGVRVAVIDGWVDAEHPGFNGQVKQQRWYRDGEWYSDGTEEYHGTHVAGTIHMLAPDAEIYNYCVFETGSAENIAIARAIRQAIKDGCQIINMSFGDTQQSYEIASAINVAYSNNVLMIVSAGNHITTNENSYPAMNNQTVSVAAVHKKNGLPTANFSNTNDAVDYAGIGVDVISFKAKSIGYMKMNGTSMATPHVCGFVAALMTKDGNYSDIITNHQSLRTLLDENFVRDIGEKGPNNSTGRGFLTYLNETEYDHMNETEYIDIW